MEKIIKTDFVKLFSAPEKRKGIEKYADIMNTFYTVNVATEKEFQKKFYKTIDFNTLMCYHTKVLKRYSKNRRKIKHYGKQ